MSEMLREIVLRMVDVVVGRGPGRLYVCHGYSLMKLLLSVRVRGRCGRLYLLRPFGEVGQLLQLESSQQLFHMRCAACSNTPAVCVPDCVLQQCFRSRHVVEVVYAARDGRCVGTRAKR